MGVMEKDAVKFTGNLTWRHIVGGPMACFEGSDYLVCADLPEKCILDFEIEVYGKGSSVRFGPTELVLEVGKGLSNNVTVVAKAVQDPALDRWIGPDNRYGPAIVDWLSKGETKFGPFHNPDFTEPGLGDFYDVSGTKVTLSGTTKFVKSTTFMPGARSARPARSSVLVAPSSKASTPSTLLTE